MSGLPPEVVTDVEQRARRVYDETLQPIAARFEFEVPPSPSETTGLPMVLFLGNHSSGKSSFINHLLGAELQRTGIAPVDDGFTIITYGERTEDKDGNAVVTNPRFAWGDLARFGPQLVSHLKLRLVENPELEGLALVDSPGMIDAADASVDRGYEFPAVVRWFAERADVILLLFDPDKPGTTGETLKVLTDSLAGLDHKLLLIFNKVDLFHTIRDFARAYGALCWNLSKAIPRKDLPHVYNTYLPVPDRPRQREGLPLEDFDASRNEVREQVQRAPERRLDNVISRLYLYTRRLRVHARVLDQLARERLRHLLSYVGVGVLLLVLGGLITYGLFRFQEDGEEGWIYAALLTLAAAGALSGIYTWDRRLREKNLTLDALFERAYARELTLGDQAADIRALWAGVRERVRKAIDARGKFGRLRRSDLRKLEKVLDKEVPALRTRVAEGMSRAEGPPLASPGPTGPEPSPARGAPEDAASS